MLECCEALEAHHVAGPWVMGDNYTICDPYLFSISEWLESDGVDITRFAKLDSHRQFMSQRGSVVSVRKQTQSG